MQLAHAVLLSLGCLAVSGAAASMKSNIASHTSAAESKGPGKVDTVSLVNSLGEVATSLEAEDKAAYSFLDTNKKQCKMLLKELQVSFEKGKRIAERSKDDDKRLSAQVQSLRTDIDKVRGQISKSNDAVDTLQARLKQMRTDKGLLKKSAASSLQQVEAVLSEAFRLEHKMHREDLPALKSEVSDLERLSESLSLLQTASSESDHGIVEQQKSSLILKADRVAVMEASTATQAGFNEEEKKVLDLIEVEKRNLQALDENLEDLQPALSNKLQESLEIKRKIDAAERGTHRDEDLLNIEGARCDIMNNGLSAQRKQRQKAKNDVLMASKLIQHMDTALFLSQDLRALKVPVAASLLQVTAGSSRELLTQAFGSSASPEVLLQEAEMSDAKLQSSVAVMATGPFDKVSQMISGLITSLKAEANEEVNQHQFCQDSLGKNRRDRIAKKLTIDALESTIGLSQMAVVRLDDDVTYITNEIARLKTLHKEELKKDAAETARVKKEFAEHKLASDVISKATVILNQLCDLGGAAASLIHRGNGKSLRPTLLQQRSTHKGSRFDQCREAWKLLKSASSEVQSLDRMTTAYLQEYSQLSFDIADFGKSGHEGRAEELTEAKGVRAARASGLARAKKDLRDAGNELILIDDAKRELEHSCSHVETREEKMAKRKNEIDALKEALKVLEGEAIPA